MTERLPPYHFMSAEDADDAQRLGAARYTRGGRYRALKESHIFPALDGAVQSMRAMGFPDPYDGKTLGAFASTLIRADHKSVGYLRSRRIAALDSSRDELFRLVGLLVAQDFRKNRREDLQAEPLVKVASVLLEHADAILQEMVAAGAAMDAGVETGGELACEFAGDDPVDLGMRLLTGQVEAFESLVPEAGDDDTIPDSVQRNSLARAAFLSLAAEDLANLAADESLVNLPTKAAMARALADKHGQDLDEVARLVLRREGGDPDFGLVSRLLPLRTPPDLDAAEASLRSLKGRYLEPRTAMFFIFGDVSRGTNVLKIDGTIRAFVTHVDDVAGKAQVNARPRSEKVTIILRRDSCWAEVNVRRTSDLGCIRSVMRRTGAIEPSGAMPLPHSLDTAPYSNWDSRTIWMLDFLRQDLHDGDFMLDDTLMAHFMAATEVYASAEEQAERARQPNVDAVRLLGRQLHEHQESCQRIVGGAHLRALEIRVRQVTNRNPPTSRLVRFRIETNDDHLAVLTGLPGINIALDASTHELISRLVREAADRSLDEHELIPILDGVVRRAAGDADASVMPQNDSTTVSAAVIAKAG
jgi:hypothetical protein